MDWTSRVRAAFDEQSRPDEDVIEELAQHAAAAYETARAEGCSREDAEARIEKDINRLAREGFLLRRRPSHPPMVEPPPVSSSRSFGLIRDMLYALRLLRRQPGHTAAVLATITLGVAASTLLFSVSYGVLLRPLPWPEAERLVRLYETRQGSARHPSLMTNYSYLAWRDNPSTLEDLGAWSDTVMTITGAGDPERITVVEATPSLFTVLRARPALSRLFNAAPGGAADETEAILSHALWQRRFGGRQDIIGSNIVLDGHARRIVGVMPPTFAFPDRDTSVWLAFSIRPVIDPAHPEMRTMSMFSAIGRLRSSVTAEQAASEGTARVASAPDPGLVGETVFGVKGAAIVLAVPFLKSLTEDVRPALLVFLAAVGFLLAIATGNVALLQLARSTTRFREIAIRAALGAGGGRLMRQVLVENAIIGLAGGLCAVIVTGWLHRALPALLPEDFPRIADITMDWRVASFALAISLVASIGFGLLPALQARRVNLIEALAEDGSAPVGGGARSATSRARLLIMAGQVAMACVLLVGAGLLMRSFTSLSHADRGYDPQNLLTARLSMPETNYTGLQRIALLNQLIERLKNLPGVTHAALAGSIPLGQGYTMSGFTMTRRDGTTVTIRALQRIVSPGYFAAFRIRLLQGRVFTDQDTLSAGSVMVVNRAFAAQYFENSAVGTRVPARFNADKPGATIIGVVENVRYRGMADKVEPEIYICTAQMSGGISHDEPYLILRSTGNPARFAPMLRSILKEQDPSLVIDSVATMEDRLQTSLARPRLYALLLGGFAGFALAIAGVGLFGTLSYGVAHRSREIAVRTALGATPRDIVNLVLRQALLVTACGAVAGVAAASVLVQLISTMLYGITTHDAFTFISVPLILILMGAVACAVPARRAARIDPLRLLR